MEIIHIISLVKYRIKEVVTIKLSKMLLNIINIFYIKNVSKYPKANYM